MHKNILYSINAFNKRIIYRINLTLGFVKRNGIKAFWWRNNGNFGDLITPCLLKIYGFTPIWVPADSSQILSTGSILRMVSQDYHGIILGSGAMYGNMPLDLPRATVLAVRGKLTRDLMKLSNDIFLGDPGLLATRLLPKRSKKIYEIGIVPHYCDSNDSRVSDLALRFKEKIKIINVLNKPLSVFREIDQCRYILSSSLHGLVVAESFGIPTAWIKLSNLVEGDGFKFHDYYSALNETRKFEEIDGTESLPILKNLTIPVPERITLVKKQLDYAFNNLKGELSKV